MVSFESYGSKDQLKSVSVGFHLANNVPRCLSCDDMGSQEQMSGECQNGLLVLNEVGWEHESGDEI